MDIWDDLERIILLNIVEILPKATIDQQVFILDHGKVVDGVLKYKDDITSYGWNIKRHNKMRVGAFVLNRHPAKIQKDHKFEIYSGGYVKSISEPDKDGNVVAELSHAFEIIPPLKQGDEFLEQFEWDSKKKKPNTWEHFWNQYGMNKISFSDFTRLTSNLNCIPVNEQDDVEELTVEELDSIQDTVTDGFSVAVTNDGLSGLNSSRNYDGVARKINFDQINSKKNKLGAIGEEIVYKMLLQDSKKLGITNVIHASKEEGDGLGYDIRYFDISGNEVHVEVKTTKTNRVDGFFMSPNELNESEKKDYKYFIYRIYNLDIESRKCNLKIFEGPINSEKYELVTKQVVVYQK